ncbi:MAG: tyrosine-type recombinase/integrase [Selenomonadaceae bacterium]|nr:tyrosine-type recombinase/integrase [Selenomonadaceae bacterium]
MMAQVRTRKRGKTFSYIFEAGKTPDGKRKVVEKGGFATKTEAYKAGVAAYNDYLHGNIGITSEKITLREFMTAWLDNFVAMRVKPNSLQTYQSHFKNQILPYLGEVKVQELIPAMLDEWIRKLTQTGLSRGTLTNTHTLIYSALKYAVYPAQLIQSNPAAYIEIPKNAPKNIVKRTIITPEQFSTLLEKYPFDTPYYILLLLLYHTGARIGEILGLSWQDIDFTSKQINLHRQIIYISNRGYFFTTLKTESSNRYIVVGDFLLGELKRWQLQQTENEKLIGGSYVHIYRESDGHIERRSKNLPAPDGEKVSLVCTRDNGQMILKNNFSQILKREGLNAHSFRHTHATRLIELGAKPTGVAGRLGHSNVKITQNLYTHNT